MPTNTRSDLLPVFALLFTATFWGVLWWPLRWLEQQGVPGLWATFALFGSACVLSLPLLWRWRAYFVRRPGLLLALTLASGWCNTAFILAIVEGHVVRVLLLFYLSPVWAVLLARFLLRERLPPMAWVTLLLALGGALVILWDPQLGMPWPQGRADVLALSSGMGFGLANVLIRRAEDVPILLKTVVPWLGVTALAGGLALTGAGGAALWQGAALPVAMLLGVLGVGLASACLVYGVSRMPVHRSAVILLFEVLAGAVSAQWLAGEVLGAREWAGGALILAAAWIAGRQGAGRPGEAQG